MGCNGIYIRCRKNQDGPEPVAATVGSPSHICMTTPYQITLGNTLGSRKTPHVAAPLFGCCKCYLRHSGVIEQNFLGVPPWPFLVWATSVSLLKQVWVTKCCETPLITTSNFTCLCARDFDVFGTFLFSFQAISQLQAAATVSWVTCTPATVLVPRYNSCS